MVEPGSVRAVQGTAAPWVWTGYGGWWRRELRDNRYQYRRLRPRLRLHDLPPLPDLAHLRDWRLQPPGAAAVSPDIAHAAAAFYTPNQIRHLIRWEGGINHPGAAPTVSGWRPWPDVNNLKLSPHPTPPSHHASEGGGWWEGAGRGLPLGAALLATILLLLRAADRCLQTNLFKLPMRRRQSEEWPTPNVLATNLSVRMTSETNSARPSSPTQPDQVDLPPPYSECADPSTSSAHNKPDPEEPPPPYSACYVTYSNPKDRPPSVHFFTRQCQNLFANYDAGPSNVHDTGQNETAQEDVEREAEETSTGSVEDGTGISNMGNVDVTIFNFEVAVDNNDSESEVKEVSSEPSHRHPVV